MKAATYTALLTVLPLLAGCSNATPMQQAIPQTESGASAGATGDRFRSGSLTELFNLDYSNGSITVFSIQNGKATQSKKFTPAHGHAQGLASDALGQIYTTSTNSSSKPCVACVLVFTETGTLVKQLDAPVLQGGSGPPSLTDISVDAHENVYVSDYGQQAVYFFRHGLTKHSPTIVVQNSQNAASVAATPDGSTVLVSGGCGFASVRPYTRVAKGHYAAGNCFGIGTIALIGGAADDQEEVLTPVDGAPGLVSVSSPTGGATFHTPDQFHASISGVALNGDASIAYVANHAKECVYAFARPAGGWLSGTQPKLLATYKGFKSLDIIAIPQ
jgi:hypothetical protein